ncbi:hypothetical protein COU80_00030 [Candidatus Peregrinibacteria bacterium CG10_big_fil_rev_8_21_14_0_10_55_24]|nr:MAG: hypothetical protein COU80_00030 [Candidatus Peregrinibacteria bacterium CG10_big_fil_rev_8_21_14_0_10_55_24]
MRNARFSIGIGLLCAIGMTVGMFRLASVAYAETTAPQRMVYNGHLLNADGTAVTTAVSVRFSFWDSSDAVSGDVTATGAINVGAAYYADWYEVHTVTPNSDGYFTLEMGSATGLPDFSAMEASLFLSLYLQVEVKAASGADTVYEILDRDAADDTVDRAPLLAVPFSLNSDLLDGRDTGTGSGSIPVLLSGGLLDVSAVPSGTNRGDFIVDADDSVQTGTIDLQFGTTLGAKLSYDVDQLQFTFNDDVEIQGNLSVSGGVQLGAYAPGSGTGAGTLRFTGSDVQAYDGTAWKNLSDGPTFVGVTSVSTDGSFGTGSLVGYQAANNFCANTYAGSHMCQVGELITTISSDVTAFLGSSNAWAAEGAPGYTSDSNDCRGWTSADNSDLGAWWEFSTDGGATVSDGGGQGFLTNCAVTQPIACCR